VAEEAATLAGLLARAAERTRAAGAEDRWGIRFVDRREDAVWLDWVALEARARRAAGALRARGVRAGDRVGIILPTSPLFVDAFLGCQVLGAVPVPLYPPVRLGRLDEYFDRTAAMLGKVDARLLVADALVRRILGQLQARWKAPLGTLAAEELSEGTAIGPVPRDPDALAMVQFSSGTTMDPKPVGLSHRAVIANTEAILDFMPEGADPPHAGVSWLPLYHDMGLIGCIFPAMHRPGPLTLIPPEVFLLRPAIWLRTLSRSRGTVSPAPDFAYGLCLDRVQDAELAGCDLSSWRLALDGAEPVSPERLRRFAERFAPWGLRPEALTPVYGLSEAALAVTFGRTDAPPRSRTVDRRRLGEGVAEAPTLEGGPPVELVSVGLPLRGFAVEVRGADRDPLPERRVGRVWVRGPSLMRGYLDRAEQPLVEGWLDTGDRGFLWDGELYICGRDKDVVIQRGRNHDPSDLERAVDDVEGVRTGCAVAVGRVGEAGEELLLFVEVRSPGADLAERCRQSVLARTGLDPGLVVLLEPGTLPRTSSGKLRRAEALRQFEAGTLLPPSAVTPWLLAGALARSALGYLRGR
jgi:fatty-acyl-CoA synthase